MGDVSVGNAGLDRNARRPIRRSIEEYDSREQSEGSNAPVESGYQQRVVQLNVHPPEQVDRDQRQYRQKEQNQTNQGDGVGIKWTICVQSGDESEQAREQVDNPFVEVFAAPLQSSFILQRV
jgi:redox-sensitive bicupin YhaK (pirin superfamily)